MIWLNICLFVVAYLLGSIPSAVWIGKRFYGVDVREHGSKNAGATNTLRVLGKKAALPVFGMDVLKGFLAVKLSLIPIWMGYEYEPSLINQIILSAAAVVGHMLPIFAKFKGGKGVATITGAMLGIATLPVVCSLLTFFIVLFAFNYVSLASITAGLLLPFYLRFLFDAPKDLVIFGVVIAVLLVITHRKNIVRLLKNSENKIYLIKKNKDNKED